MEVQTDVENMVRKTNEKKFLGMKAESCNAKDDDFCKNCFLLMN